MYKSILTLILLIFSSVFLAADEVRTLVITPSGYETQINKVGGSVTVISSEEIANSGYQTVSEILNTVPGIHSVSTGFGGTVSLFSRGHDSDMTKIMLDGVDLNDPSAFGTTAVLSTLMLNNINRIEIVRGPQSLISGADAMGGVINIITNKSIAENSVSASTGSNNTHSATVKIGTKQNEYNINLNISEFQTKGINVRTVGNDDNDGFDQTSMSLSVNRDFNGVGVKFNYKNQAGRVEYDESTSQARPIFADNDYIFLNTGIDYKYSPNTLLSIEYNKSDFDRRDNGQWGNTNYFSKVEMLKGKSKIIHDGNIVLVGIETKSEEYLGTYAPPNKNSVSEQSFIIQNEFNNNNNTSILAGVRVDNHEAYGNYTTFKASLNQPLDDFPGLIVKASIGTGFRAPTLGELYGQFNANQSLQPEESLGYEFGFINYLSSKLDFGSTYFKSEIEDAITYGSPMYYNASGTSEREGVETYVNIYPFDNFSLKINHTHLTTDEKVYVRRPNNKLSSSLNYKFDDQMDIFGSLIAVEDHYDVGSVKIDSFQVLDAGINYTPDKSTNLKFKINNLTNERYEQISGYPGLPRQIFLEMFKSF
tara:strand:- start:1139 stop:2914 length:1776 start_codon:yes stop_codon:yes gene_type:complete